MRTTFLCMLLIAGVLVPAMPARAQATIFKFESDEFWLNLHKFLYVLGRAQTKDPNASREAVAAAPGDADLASVLEWPRHSRRSADGARPTHGGDAAKSRSHLQLRGRWLLAEPASLAALDGTSTLANVKIDPALRSLLEQAAPIFFTVGEAVKNVAASCH